MNKAPLAGLILALVSSSFVIPSTAKTRLTNHVVGQTASAHEAHDAHSRGGLEDFDVRRDPDTLVLNGAAAFSAKRAPVDRSAAIDLLVAKAPISSPESLTVELHDSGIPKSVANFDGFLTEPRAGSPDRIAREFLAEHAGLFGLSPAEVADLKLTVDDLDRATGVTYLKYEQTVNGVPVFDSEMGVTITPRGEVAIVNQGQTLPGAAVSTEAALQPETAVARAFEHCGVEVLADAVRPSLSKRDNASPFAFFANPLGEDRQDVAIQKTVVNVNGDAVLAFRALLQTADGASYDTLVDANTGELLMRVDLARHLQGTVFKVSPSHSNRTVEQFAPKFGVTDSWGGTILSTGNNASASAPFADLNAPGMSYGFADPAKGSPAGQYSYAWSPYAAPTAQPAQSVANLFYFSNYMHDWMYSLGFTESARNFQQSNYNRGGVQEDPVLARAMQDWTVNAARFSTYPDGIPGALEVGMYTSPNPDRDGALDSDIVLHEYGHGVSNRLIGNGSGLNGTQSRALGEGWSDYWACSHSGDGNIGEYVNSGYPLRRAIYAVPTNAVHDSYADVGAGGFDPQRDGEVWAVTLWDLNRTLGKTKADKLVLDGMKNTPTSPSMVAARTGIITACNLLYPADVCTVWTVFARHGLGYSASGNDGTTHNAAINIPPSCGGYSTCAPTSMSPNVVTPHTITASLAATDCHTPAGDLRSSAFFDKYTYAASEGFIMTVSMNSTAFDTYLRLKDPSGAVVASNNNYAGNLNAKIVYTIPADGTYTIEALSWLPFAMGSYTITLGISNLPGGRCEQYVGYSQPYTVERSGKHIIKTHWDAFFTLQKWDGANWIGVYSVDAQVNDGGLFPPLYEVGSVTLGPGTYRWSASGRSPYWAGTHFCYDWP